LFEIARDGFGPGAPLGWEEKKKGKNAEGEKIACTNENGDK
jgi:hypothetical protein